MSTVYRGTDTRLDRVVAVKVMHPSLAGDEDFTGRFIREAKAVARLAHPNVVNVFDQGADGAHVFLAMEYVPGRTLRDLLRDRGRSPSGPPWTSWSRCSPRSAPPTGPVSSTATSSPRTC